MVTIMSLCLYIEPGHMKDLQGRMLISPFVDSQWLLYTQPVMSEGNTAETKMRTTLDAIEKSQDCQISCICC